MPQIPLLTGGDNCRSALLTCQRAVNDVLDRRVDRRHASGVTRIVDAEGVHLGAILRAADFSNKRVLEVGCGDGRLTWGIAATASSVLAFDPKADDIRTARSACPEDLRERVRFEVASAGEIEVEPQSVDLVFFSWSL